MGDLMKNAKDNKNVQLSQFEYDKIYQLFRLPEQIRSLEAEYAYSDGKVEKYIFSSINSASDISDNSEELMSLVKDWPSYYHLGIGRSNVLKCLDLKSKINVLELGSGCGAITRYLGENFESVDSVEGSLLRARITRERCRDLDNVRVFCSDIKQLEFENKYDVVTLIGVLEYSSVYFANDKKENPFRLVLELAKSALKPTGILIIAIENKIGLKYWSGCPEDHTGQIYDGIHGYPVDGTPMTFSKKEIGNFLNEVGFGDLNYYYCFPDYKFTTEALSDCGDEKQLHLHNWVNAPFNSYNIPRKYTFHEGLALKSISDAGLLREFANSFLIVAGNSSNIVEKPDWVAKKFTLNRLKEFQCITTLKLKPDRHIEKIRLNANNGKLNVGIIKNDDCILNISHNVCESTWHKGDLLTLEVYKALYKKDFKNEISNILQKYYQEISKRYYTGKTDEQEYPLLQGCAGIDAIFRNFIVNERSELIPIDTEWQVEGYIPADYLVYKCIMNDVSIIGENKINNVDKFTINIMRTFFPQYGKRRNKSNKVLNESFQKMVSNEVDVRKFFDAGRFSSIIHNKIIWNYIIIIWNKTPNFLKNLMKSTLRLAGQY